MFSGHDNSIRCCSRVRRSRDDGEERPRDVEQPVVESRRFTFVFVVESMKFPERA